MKKIFLLLPCLFLLQWTQLIGANNNSISTSRPGIGNPTSAVPAGLYQFEMGTNLTTRPGIDTPIVIPVLLRMGVYKNTELQMGFANKYLTFGILYGGIRIIDGFENSIILTSSLSIPMDGISHIDNNDSLAEYSAYLPISYSFQNGITVEGQVVGTFFNNNKLDPIISYSLSGGSNIGDKFGWFIEAYQSQTIGNKIADENIPISVDCGFTFLSNNNFQFDLSIGLTFQEDDNFDYIETERFLEGGVSIRLPE